MTSAIEVDDVSKRFRVYREKPTSLKQRLLSRAAPAPRTSGRSRDVSFEVAAGRHARR